MAVTKKVDPLVQAVTTVRSGQVAIDRQVVSWLIPSEPNLYV